jgi:adenosylcobinamide-GDP ribazoletransferase
MRDLADAFGFLTALPLGKGRDLDAPRTVPYFPLVGLVLGAALALGDSLFSRLWPAPVASLLDVLLLAALSGGLHLDGLGDTADGLLSHRPPERVLEIMRDSRTGVMGVLAIVFVLGIKWASLQSLGSQRALWLLVIPAYSRGAMMFGIRFLPYGRPGGGLGTDFFAQKPSWTSLSTIGVPVLFSLLLEGSFLGLNMSFAVLTGLILLYYRRRLGCLTGDMLGALTEVEEAALFLIAALGVGP